MVEDSTGAVKFVQARRKRPLAHMKRPPTTPNPVHQVQFNPTHDVGGNVTIERDGRCKYQKTKSFLFFFPFNRYRTRCLEK